jgi:hypothetical protein
MRFEIVTSTELVKVHNPAELFEACEVAGIGIVEATLGMVVCDDGLYLRVENTRRVPKTRRERVKATIDRSPPPGRILELASRYAAIPAAFDDNKDSNYSPLDD